MNLPKTTPASLSTFLNGIKNFFFIVLIGYTGFLKAQPSFNMSSTLCAASTLSVTANTGTFSATGFTWSSISTGPVFSSPNASVCDIYFSNAGTYTIVLSISGATSSGSFSHIIMVYPLPVLTLTASASLICFGDAATLTASGAASYTWNPFTGLYFLSPTLASVFPYSTTGYSVTGTSSLGCSGNASCTITVNNYPNLIINASSTSVCAGYSSALTALGATNYTWTSATFSAPVTQPTLFAGAGTYVLIGANGACKDSTSLIIALVPPLTLSLIASRSVICVNDGDSLLPVLLNVFGAGSYSWAPYQPGRITYSIGPSTAVSPTSTTCYTVTGVTNVCKGSAIVCVNVETCTGFEEEKKSTILSVYPNPVQNKLIIRSNMHGVCIIKVMTITCELIKQEIRQMTDETQELDTRDLLNGIYFIRLETPCETTRTIRFIKQ